MHYGKKIHQTARLYKRKYGKISGANRAYGVSLRCKSYEAAGFWNRVTNVILGWGKYV